MPGKTKKDLKEAKDKEQRSVEPMELPVKRAVVNLGSDFSSSMLSQSLASGKVIQNQTHTFCE